MDFKRRHFHTFDALRFLSFLLVFIHHIPVPENSWFYLFTKSGDIGVSFFFVLSGFLISYILFFEKNSKKKINLKNFFAKRVLKIWPLFYALLIFAYLTPQILKLLQLSFSNEGYEPNWLMSGLFLENYKMMFTNSFPNVSPLRVMWSLCIEEHFYILWSLLFAIIPINKIKYLILGAIVAANIFRGIFFYYNLPFLDVFTNIDYFAYGAIPAYILGCRKEDLFKFEKLSFTFKIATCIFTLILIFVVSNLDFEWIKFIKPILFGSLFALILFFTITEKNSLKIKDTKWISRLGIYTYGLYLYHTIIINLFIKLNKTFEFNWIVISILSLITTILISIISNSIFEKQFLKLKANFN
ncbi:acyltransferase family protein [Flavobacterium channae]|uniref:acyltransferase family protein n=1 Tax=Flavobacterium channae TaxID=2897181 RepID=UPI001E39725B|nr:acyltransferase [Flavobacterium channae]UGS24671.1 acyltransferase [Flavobacterium channae]